MNIWTRTVCMHACFCSDIVELLFLWRFLFASFTIWFFFVHERLSFYFTSLHLSCHPITLCSRPLLLMLCLHVSTIHDHCFCRCVCYPSHGSV